MFQAAWGPAQIQLFEGACAILYNYGFLSFLHGKA